MNTSNVNRLLALALIALGGVGCGDLSGIPQARTEPPPNAFDEMASYAWQAAWGMSQDEFDKYCQQQTQAGYRLHDIEVYRYDDQTRFAGIWLKDPRAWRAT